MKKIKKMVLSLLGGGATAGAIALVLTSAGINEPKKLADPLWKFEGSSNPMIPDNPHDPSQYRSATASESCEGSTTICLIEAPASSGQPNLNANVGTSGQTVDQQITDALSTGDVNDAVKSFQDR